MSDAYPEELVTVASGGPMTLRRAVRQHQNWREHHGLTLVLVYREIGKEPSLFDVADLERRAEIERFK